MKKVAAVVIIIILCLGVYFLLGNGNNNDRLPDPLSQDQLLPESIPKLVDKKTDEVLGKVISPKTRETKAYKSFVDVGFKAPFYLREAELGAQEGREFLEETFNGLKECFKEGGQRSPTKPALRI